MKQVAHSAQTTSRPTPAMLEHAARLMSRLQSGDAGLAQQAESEVQQWRTEDAAHDVAWLELQSTSSMLDEQAQALRQTFGSVATLRPVPVVARYQHPVWRPLAASLMLCALASAGWEAFARWMPVDQRELLTAVGEYREFPLADGSVITLNTGSHVRVYLTRRTRRVELLQGEVFFDVSHNKHAPFRVAAQDVTVTVRGTRFRVLQSRQRQVVSVESGHVQVEREQEDRVDLLARQEWSARPGQPADVLPASHLEQQLAWRNGQLIFQNQPLVEVLAEVQRYRQQPIRFEGSPQLAGFKVSAVFPTDKLEAFFTTLPLATPARVDKQHSGLIRVY
jgi:transmembrane sensor